MNNTQQTINTSASADATAKASVPTSASLSASDTIYPQLPSYLSQSQIPTLCLTCSCHPATCPWLCSQQPHPNWEAIPTSIYNGEEREPYSSYKVISCPQFKPTPDYYTTSGDLIRLLAHLSGHGVRLVYKHMKQFMAAFEEYSSLYPRTNLDMTQEERSKAYSDILKKYYQKGKGRKKYTF